ncbi:hypothetical protein ACVWYH_004460 [Bradyrhizobium sp. GM24.11]
MTCRAAPRRGASRTKSTRSGAWILLSTTLASYAAESRGSTPERHAVTLAINTLAPYMLTALIERADRLVYLTSGLNRGGKGSLDDLDRAKRSWDSAKAYAQSKLHVVSWRTRWRVAAGPEQRSIPVGPARGWGGASAPVDVETGQKTQAWLAVSDDPAAQVSGCYWHHLRQQELAGEAADTGFQDKLIDKLGEMTGVALPGS